MRGLGHAPGVSAALAVIGASSLAGGVALSARRSRIAAAYTVQAAGLALLGAAGAVIFATGAAVGARFHSEVGAAFGIDRLSGFFLAVLAVSAVPALVYARGTIAETAVPRVLAALTGAFVLAVAGVLTARDPLTLLLFWELMTMVPAAAIVVARRDAAVRRSVFVYLGITHLGGAGVWLAVLVLAHAGAIGGSAGLAAHGVATQTLVALAALVGFGTKAGLVPLHSWLPRAHPVAPSHVSAVMSGVMIKVAIYGLIRVLFEWLGPTPVWVGIAVAGLGVVSALSGVLYALFQHELKRLLAFHSIENMGIIALGLGASLVFHNENQPLWAAIAFAAALLHVANHAIFKSLLFLSAGAMHRAVHDLELDRLGGLLRRMPFTGWAFLVGAMAIAGLPPLNGFASEWLVLQSLVHVATTAPGGVAGAGAVAAAGLAATAALAVFCFVKVTGLVLLGPPRRPAVAAATEVSATMWLPQAFLAVMCVALGIAPGLLVPRLATLAWPAARLDGGPGLDIPGTGSLPALGLAISLGLVMAGLLVLRGRGHRSAQPSPVWACGQRIEAPLAWSSAGFTKPLRLVLAPVLRPERAVERTERGGVLQRIAYSSEVPHLFDTHLYRPVLQSALRTAGVARRFQSGSLRAYVASLFALIGVLLVLLRIGVFG